MKEFRKITILVGILVISVVFLSGCSTHIGYIPMTNTDVQLSRSNYKVVDSVTGSATASYALMVFGPLEQNLIGQARREMIKNANLVGYSKAIANVTIDYKITWFYPLFYQKTYYVSGEVIEFTDK